MLCLRILVLLGGLLICVHLSTAENEPLGPTKSDHEGSNLSVQRNVDDYILDTIFQLKTSVAELRAEITILRENENRNILIGKGRSYIHWGRKHCPALHAQMVYSGYIAGGYYKHSGSGRDYICTTDKPAFLPSTGSTISFAYMYGTEYEFHGVFKDNNVNGGTLDELGAVCSVCEATAKNDVIMVPGTYKCPDGWQVEYNGFLAAMYYEYYGTNHICLDQAPEAITGSTHNYNGNLLYPVRAKCGALPCPPYVNNKEVSCVVCSK